MLREFLQKLAAMEPIPLPLLSAYIDLAPELEGSHQSEKELQDLPPLKSWRRDEVTDPEQRLFRPGTTVMRALLSEKEALFEINSVDRESYDADRERILEFMNHNFDPASKGAAIFACYGADIWEVVELPVSVETQLFVDRKPFVSPLAYIEDTYDRYALCLADGQTARVYVVGLGRKEHEETIEGPSINRTMTGGWSQRRIQQRIDNAVSEHIREVSKRLEEIVFAEDIPYIILAGDEYAKTEFRNHLSERAWERVVEMERLDIKTPEHEAIAKTIDQILEAEEQDGRDMAQQAVDAALANGLGAVGLEAVVEALRLGAVHQLVVSNDFQATGWRCVDDMRMVGTGKEPAECPVGPGPAEQADLREELVSLSLNTGAEVEFVEESDTLERAGGIAAILRWRPDNLPNRMQSA